MSVAGDVYRRVLPAGLRGVLWHARNGGLTRLADPRVRRDLFAQLRLRVGSPRAVVAAPHGRFVVDLRDRWIGRRLFVEGAYEPAECALLSSLVQPGDRVLDVGANIGILSVLASQRAGPTGRVVSVEPDPYNGRLLRRNLALNRCTNVTVCPVAAGAAAGEATLYTSATNFGDHRLYADDSAGGRGATVVPVVRLDDLYDANGWPYPTVVKIDVQGLELQVVRGLNRAFAAGGPMSVLTEYWPHGMANSGGSAAEFLAYFRGHGFTAFVPGDDGSCVPVAWADIDARVPPLRPDLPDGAYINLLFRR